MESVNELLEFVKSGSATSSSISVAIKAIGAERLQSVAIEVLSWLEYLLRGGRIRVLELHPASRPHKDLASLMRDHGCFGDILTLNPSAVELRETVSPEERESLLKLIDDRFEKRLFVTYRPKE